MKPKEQTRVQGLNSLLAEHMTLDLYAEPYDPQRPVVCFDESSTQLLADTREPVPAGPGRPKRQDYEYRREETRNLFLACEPRAGWRHVAVTERRTKEDFARQMQWLVDEAYPDVPVVRLVLDNLNTHRMASLYETFPAAEALRDLPIPPSPAAPDRAGSSCWPIPRGGELGSRRLLLRSGPPTPQLLGPAAATVWPVRQHRNCDWTKRWQAPWSHPPLVLPDPPGIIANVRREHSSSAPGRRALLIEEKRSSPGCQSPT